jgi:hypothetical protein
MSCQYLQMIKDSYRVTQRTVNRWCAQGRIKGASRRGKRDHWRVRKPEDFDQWQKEVVAKLGVAPEIKQSTGGFVLRGNYRLKLETREPFEVWGSSERQAFGLALVDALVGLVRLNILEPVQYDPKKTVRKCEDDLRLGLVFKSGEGKNKYQTERIEEHLAKALRAAGKNAWRENKPLFTQSFDF